ncbi:MAG: hypothetical protein JW944_11335 [Deltaproteobacteria bacterium]|nr:hypothetical protein [Deltaproteobacteria bacterium]
MKKKLILGLLILITVFSTCLIFAENQASIAVTGMVKQPLTLAMEDLARFQTVKVQLNEVMKDGTFRGVFYYQGVTLRNLLDTAIIEKKDKSFSKHIDMAIKIRNREGKEVVLSWGEIYYRNSGDIIVATSAAPIMPHKSCASCHESSFYKPYMDQLSRGIEFPKLVVGSDGYSDRCLEGIVSIEVIDPPQNKGVTGDSSAELSTPSFKITGIVKNEMTVTDVSKYQDKEMEVIFVGEGKGFHGIRDYSGASLYALLDDAGIDYDLTTAIQVSAPDGYRSLFSYGEIFLNRDKESIFVADIEDGKAIKEGGKFFLIPTDDIMADRDVKSIKEIQVFKID